MTKGKALSKNSTDLKKPELIFVLKQIAVDLRKGGKKANEALKKLDLLLGIED